MALETNLISGWSMEGNSNDVGSGGNSGSDTAMTYATANGKIKKGALFNGTTSNISIANNANLNFVNAAFSVSLWFNSPNTNSLDWVDKSQTSTSNGWRIDYINGLRAIGSTTYNPAYSISANTWYHVVFTFDGSATGKFYVNGTIVGSGGTYHNNNAWTGALKLGVNSAGNAEFYSGNLDEVYIWSRELTAGEVTSLWNGGSGLTFNGSIFIPNQSFGLMGMFF
jgi:hypothetical protein